MDVDIRHVDVHVSQSLRLFAEKRVERALRPFLVSVRRVVLHIEDVNGPRGGVDIQCTVTVEAASTRRAVVVMCGAPDVYGAVQAACGRLSESVSRVVNRRRRLDRRSADPVAAPAAGADGPIHVTRPDLNRLRSLIEVRSEGQDLEACEALADELDRAEMMPQGNIPGDVVTMNTRFVLHDETTGKTREMALVYPIDSDPDRGRISVLAPVGGALLGLTVGQAIDWPLPRGKTKRMRLVRVLYQPERAGHVHL